MKNILMLIVISFAITGCSTKPITNIQNELIPIVETTKAPTLEEIEKAILQASEALGWEGKTIEPGIIETTYTKRNFDATIDITYTEKDFDINYKNSHNLKYNDGKIHKNYNRWIANLSKNIKEKIKFNSSLTGDEPTLTAVEGLSFWNIDGVRKANVFKILATGKGIKQTIFTPGIHTFGAIVKGTQIDVDAVYYKAKHEYLVDYAIEGDNVYLWVKDLTDNIIVAGKER